MIRYRLRMLFLTGVLGGISLSVLYINPYGGEISLSEALLQLSGSRGDFPMGFAMTEMVSFSLRLLPAYLFELFFGIMLYRHFCTASIYIFSRYPKRVRWYFRECLALGGGALLFQVLLVRSAAVPPVHRRWRAPAGIVCAGNSGTLDLWGYFGSESGGGESRKQRRVWGGDRIPDCVHRALWPGGYAAALRRHGN